MILIRTFEEHDRAQMVQACIHQGKAAYKWVGFTTLEGMLDQILLRVNDSARIAWDDTEGRKESGLGITGRVKGARKKNWEGWKREREWERRKEEKRRQRERERERGSDHGTSGARNHKPEKRK